MKTKKKVKKRNPVAKATKITPKTGAGPHADKKFKKKQKISKKELEEQLDS